MKAFIGRLTKMPIMHLVEARNGPIYCVASLVLCFCSASREDLPQCKSSKIVKLILCPLTRFSRVSPCSCVYNKSKRAGPLFLSSHSSIYVDAPIVLLLALVGVD